MGWLQSLGVFPTCVRQTGLAFSGTMASIFGIAGPYIVYLVSTNIKYSDKRSKKRFIPQGTNVDARLPYVVILCLALMGAISSTFLPETINQILPETLEEAYAFGKHQKFWSFAVHKKKQRNTPKLYRKRGSLCTTFPVISE